MIRLLDVLLHGGGATPLAPYPHWQVLIAAVIGVWVLIAGGVLATDAILAAVLERRK